MRIGTPSHKTYGAYLQKYMTQKSNNKKQYILFIYFTHGNR